MKKQLSTFVTLLIFSSFISAQDVNTTNDTDISVDKSLTTANILLFFPGVNFEYKLSATRTFVINPHISWSLRGTNDKTDFYLLPSLNLEYRKYYNFGKRMVTNKNITHNSGNYVALKALGRYYPYPVWNEKADAYLGPVWGMQRTYHNKLNIGLELGWLANISSSGDTPFIDFKVGFLLKSHR